MNSSVLTNKDIPTALIKVKTIHIKSWALKNWCFWTVVLEKTFESPLDCKEIQPVHPKGDSPGCSLEGLMLKLKLQYFGLLMRRAVSLERPWCWERLGAGGEGDDRGWDGWMAHRLDGHEFEWTYLFRLFMGLSRQEYWSGLLFPSPVDHVLFRTLHQDPSVLSGPTWHGS